MENVMAEQHSVWLEEGRRRRLIYCLPSRIASRGEAGATQVRKLHKPPQPAQYLTDDWTKTDDRT